MPKPQTEHVTPDGTPCGEKLRYRSRKLAAEVAKRQAKRTGEPIVVYHCDTHHCWHIGHEPGWKKTQVDNNKQVTTAVALKKLLGASGQVEGEQV